jgi:uncharacterized damage-inducible protein DinB
MLCSMTIAQSLLPEFDMEMKTTRTVLERVPDGRDDYKPHDKSASLSSLAAHVASLLGLGISALQPDTEYDFNPPGGQRVSMPKFESTEKNLANFDQRVRETRAAIAGSSDEFLMQMWTLKYQGNTLFSMPRVSALRTLMMNHLIHHRAQLGVYLRMNDIPVPRIYGPTADEPM